MIRLEQFEAGRLEKGTNGYTFFVPNKINYPWQWQDPEINQLLERAAVKLGELNACARLVPNIDRFLQLHINKEAVLSSRIEGTQTNIEEALLAEEDISPERKNDWREVQNYILALRKAIDELVSLPLSSRLICNTHAVLLDSVRGEHKQPGEFRRSQNWIGGSSPANAVFVPPHHDYVPELMGDLENFLHNSDIQVPDLIRIGIAHYQFETILPFLDGNGRIGRLMIPLFLVDRQILDLPLLYLSSYFERNKGSYYDHLTFVRTRNDMQQWLKYFLQGMAETAEQGVSTLSAVLKLKLKLEQDIPGVFGRRAHAALTLLQFLFKSPVVDVSLVCMACNLSKKAANDLVSKMVEMSVLTEVTGKSRGRIFRFDPYVKLFV